MECGSHWMNFLTYLEYSNRCYAVDVFHIIMPMYDFAGLAFVS